MKMKEKKQGAYRQTMYILFVISKLESKLLTGFFDLFFFLLSFVLSFFHSLFIYTFFKRIIRIVISARKLNMLYCRCKY